MGKKWYILNAGLLLITALLAWQLQVSKRRFDQKNDLARIQPPSSGETANPRGIAPALPPFASPRPYDVSEFLIVTDQNVFSATRSNQKEEPPPAVQEVVELKSKPLLVGVTLIGNQRLASIVDPAASPTTPGDRRIQTKRLGDVYQGFTIVDITEDRMVLQNGTRQEVVSMHDPSQQRNQGGKTPIIATRIINFGPKTAPSVVASAAANLQIPSQTTSGAPVVGMIMPSAEAPGRQGLPVNLAGQSRGLQPVGGPRGVDAQKNAKVLNTPMGQIVTFPP